MNRLTSFVAGVVAGAIGLYACMNFYIVHTGSGVELVRKSAPVVEFPYVDIRKFTAADWHNHRQLAAAIAAAGKGDILKESAVESIGRSVSTTIDDWASDPQWAK